MRTKVFLSLPLRIMMRRLMRIPDSMAAKNLYLEEPLTKAATAVARSNPRHRTLSRLVSSLLAAHLRANAKKAREICQREHIPFPADLISTK